MQALDVSPLHMNACVLKLRDYMQARVHNREGKRVSNAVYRLYGNCFPSHAPGMQLKLNNSAYFIRIPILLFVYCFLISCCLLRDRRFGATFGAAFAYLQRHGSFFLILRSLLPARARMDPWPSRVQYFKPT